MSEHPANSFFDLTKARDYLEFALQFTPQYGDSFLEMMRLIVMQVDTSSEQSMAESQEELNKLRQLCVHAEPNYGLLWFFNKTSITDNAYDIWERTLSEMLKGKKEAQASKTSKENKI